MDCPCDSLRADAIRVWQAGVDAVHPRRLMASAIGIEHGTLLVAGEAVRLDAIRRIAVVGAGKAGTTMATALVERLGPRLVAEKDVTGWINVPDNCVQPDLQASLGGIHLHAARPAGMNEPTAAGVAGSEQILRIVGALSADDLCLCLLSGGGSALLPAPIDGVSLADKLALTRHLSAAGANIAQLNTVRKQLSRIKGGGLARACRAGRLVTLILSDVLGDPLDVIASGPTVPNTSTPHDALAVLRQFAADSISPRVIEALTHRAMHQAPSGGQAGCLPPRAEGDTAHAEGDTARASSDRSPTPRRATHVVIGNNATAVAAAADEARRLGYTTTAHAATTLEGLADTLGAQLADEARRLAGGGRRCLVAGGEPVVQLVPEAQRGLGGRNQQLVLAALCRLLELRPDPDDWASAAANLALLSGGTDGEDGPTDAAGAVVDSRIAAAAQRLKLDPRDYLRRNDAYHFFQPVGGLIQTGPTGTNVCDVRVVALG